MSGFALWANLTPTTTVLDVGGSPGVWALVPVVPNVTLLNLQPSTGGLRQIVGDATRLPFADKSFDFVFSNSVIEHVSDHLAFANEIQRVGRAYFVQTPNKVFPMEPHVMTPIVNYFPKGWQKRLYRNFTLWGWLTRPSQSHVDWFVDDTNLVDRGEMVQLFPYADVSAGRSIIARRFTVVDGPRATSEPRP